MMSYNCDRRERACVPRGKSQPYPLWSGSSLRQTMTLPFQTEATRRTDRSGQITYQVRPGRPILSVRTLAHIWRSRTCVVRMKQ
ncbi:hypothetical protein IG631_12276 [Alternaria alternata]|nr:hypothetical protein IG631_12276 [Alternaria alternata]